MTDEHKSTRLGDLLIERGAITRAQLLGAIELQQARRQQSRESNTADAHKQELGEILVELGFINRKELASSLSWQKRLRKTTAVMIFIAPLLTAACGGGGGGSGSTNVQSQTASSQTANANPEADKPAVSPVTSSSSSSSSSSVKAVSSISSSSVTAPVSSLASSSAAADSAIGTVNGPVQIYWTAPNKRENGVHLDITELGGYELRYKRTSDERYKSINIDDSYTDSYYFDNLEGEYEFQIAAYDVNGVYSPFVQVSRK